MRRQSRLSQAEPSYDGLWSSTWGRIQQVGPVHRHVHENLVRVVRELDVKSILDVGCGSGETLALLAASGRYDLCGVDVSDRALEHARERAPSARLERLDVEHERLAEQFDLVLSVGVIEHIVDDIGAFRNIASMATKYVYTSTIAGRMRPSELEIGHVRNYSDLELSRKLSLAGLEVVWVRRWGFPFYSPLYRTFAELLPGGPPGGEIGGVSRLIAEGVYRLYGYNVPGRGDMLSALARVP